MFNLGAFMEQIQKEIDAWGAREHNRGSAPAGQNLGLGQWLTIAGSAAK